MASTHRAPKQWSLSKNETISSFENWRQNLIYTLSLDSNFAPFLVEGVTWGKKTRAQPLRGFTDDGEDVAENQRQTAQQKVNFLELMLGQIANYKERVCPPPPINNVENILLDDPCLEIVLTTLQKGEGGPEPLVIGGSGPLNCLSQ